MFEHDNYGQVLWHQWEYLKQYSSNQVVSECYINIGVECAYMTKFQSVMYYICMIQEYHHTRCVMTHLWKVDSSSPLWSSVSFASVISYFHFQTIDVKFFKTSHIWFILCIFNKEWWRHQQEEDAITDARTRKRGSLKNYWIVVAWKDQIWVPIYLPCNRHK